MKKYHFSYYKRKIIWLLNALLSLFFRLSKPFRNKKIWVFGCWEGKRYDDNSRYLYEYILNYKKDIRPIWISSDIKIIEKLNLEGKEAYYSKSLKGIITMMRAGVCFYTNGLDDFSDICLLYGSNIVCLNHGNTGIKKAAYTLNKYAHNKVLKKFKIIRDKIFSYYFYNECVATSKISSELFKELYGDKDDRKYIITGMPRNDLLTHKELFKVKKPPFIEEGFKYILYMPTYREYKNSVIKDLIDNLICDEKFNNILEENKIKFLIKPHNIDTTSKKVKINNKNYKFINSDEIESTQILMSFCDYLITDYSSCSIDFALKNKPVFFYTPDIEHYNRDNGFREMWMKFYKNHNEFKYVEKLKCNLISCIIENSKNTDVINWINSIYLCEEIKDTIYSENIYCYIKKRIGLSSNEK